MSGIGSTVGPTEASEKVEPRPQSGSDKRRQPRRPRPPPAETERVAAEPHVLDLEA